MVDKTYDTQEEWQEIVGVAGSVVLHLAWQVLLWTEIHRVQSLDTRQPISVGDGYLRGLYVILATYKVPKEVSPIHIVELVGEEVVEVFEEGRLHDGLRAFAIVIWHLLTKVEYLLTHRTTTLVIDNVATLITHKIHLRAVCSPRFIVLLLLHIVPHSWEEVHKLIGINIVVNRCALLVDTLLRVVVVETLFGVVLNRCRIRRTIEQRAVTILVAVEHREQSSRVVGVVRVHRRIYRCTNCYRGVR